MHIGTGIVIGAGVALLAPKVFPIIGGIFKTVTKGAIKAGLLTYDGGKGVVQSTTATFGDLAKEAKEEMGDKGPPKALE